MKNPLKSVLIRLCRVVDKIKKLLQHQKELAIEKKEYDPNVVRIAFVNFWFPFEHQHMLFFLYPIERFFYETNLKNYQKRYVVVKKYKPDIVFFSVMGDKKEVDKFNTPYKIFYTGEDISKNSIGDYYKQYLNNCIDETKFSIGFDFENSYSQDNYIRMPNFIKWFFAPYFNKDDIKKVLSKFGQKNQRKKFCSLISSHDKKNTRTAIYKILSKAEKIDCPGLLFHNDDTLKTIFRDNKILYLKQYKFNICPENTLSNGYVTEKLWEALYSGCIPIYACGNIENPEPDIINPEIFIGFNPYNIDTEIVNEVKKLNKNEKLLNSWWEKPIFCDTAVDKIYEILTKYNEKISVIAEEVMLEKQKEYYRNY